MRPLFLCNSDYFGGAEGYSLALAKALSHRGHGPVMGVTPGSRMWTEAQTLDGVDVLPLDIGGKLSKGTAVDMAVHWRRYRGALSRLIARAVAQYKVDLVHAQFKKEQLLLPAALGGRTLPVIWTEHGPLPDALAGLPPARALYRKAASLTQRIICVSDAVRQNLTFHGVPVDRLRVCHAGVDRSSLESKRERASLRTALGIAPDEFLVGAVSRLVPLKGLKHFVEAATIVARDLPEARFLVVGDGPERAALEAAARAAGVDQRMVFLGYRQHVGDVLDALDLFVSPSLAEGLGLSIVEAMLLNVPVVASNVGGIPEVLDHGNAGVLVPPGDSSGLAAAIRALLKDPGERRRLAAEGRERARSRFTLERMVDGTEGYLLDAIGGSSSTVGLPPSPSAPGPAAAP